MHGEARDAPGYGNLLQFREMDVGQSALVETIKQLEAIEDEFPLSGKPERQRDPALRFPKTSPVMRACPPAFRSIRLS